MPVVPFETLPDQARVWVFGSDAPLTGERKDTLLKGVDAHLDDWKAHGAPLTVGREWRDDHFLVVAVDQSTAGASGCSIDGLYRTLQQLEAETGAKMVSGGRVFFRNGAGQVQSASRAEIADLAGKGELSRDSVVFDTTLTDLGTFRECFERPAKQSWVAELLP